MMHAVCVAGILGSTSCTAVSPQVVMTDMGQQTLDSLYTHYRVEGTMLLREHYPFDPTFKADYLADGNATQGNPYSYLWPFSGTLSAVKALYEATGDKAYISVIDNVVMPGLECYSDTLRAPRAYASYVKTAAPSDRFYDDNLWIGIDMAELYLGTGKKDYIDKAVNIWNFIESGTDSLLDGGIYWCEQKKHSKNTCANAPAAVMAIRLYQATGDSAYLQSAIDIYDWTRNKLQDRRDALYFDNIRLDGRVGRAKYAYNSGQMLQSAALLYQITGDKAYLGQADEIAANAFRHFVGGAEVADGKGEFKLFSPGSIWFAAIMMRGFDAHSRVTGNTEYMDVFVRIMKYAWTSMRDPVSGLFSEDWTGTDKKDKKWLLTQAAMVEMYANAAQYLKRK